MKDTEEGSTRLPNGCTLYWKRHEAGGRRYISDETGCGVTVWDAGVVDDSTLLAALTKEAELQRWEWEKRRRMEELGMPLFPKRTKTIDDFFDRIFAALVGDPPRSTEELKEDLRAAGVNPDRVIEKGRELFDAYLKRHKQTKGKHNG